MDERIKDMHYMSLIFKRPVDKNPIMENFSLSFPVLFMSVSFRVFLSLPLMDMHMHPHAHSYTQRLSFNPGE